MAATALVGLGLASCGRGPDSDDAAPATTLSESATIAPVEESSTSEQPTEGAAQDGSGQESETGQPTREPELSLSDFDMGSPVSGSDGVFTANPGQCLTEPEPDSPVSCNGQHRAEVFYTFNLPEGDYPGDDAVANEADTQCTGQREAYLGGEDTDSTYGVTSLMPSQETWDDDGDTEVICLLTTEDPTDESAFQSMD